MRNLLLILVLLCAFSVQGDQFGVSKGDRFCVTHGSSDSIEKCGITDVRPSVSGYRSIYKLKEHPFFNLQTILLSPTMGACAVQVSRMTDIIDEFKHKMRWKIIKKVTSTLFKTEESYEYGFGKNELNTIIADIEKSLKRVYGDGRSYDGFYKMTPSNFNFENSGLPVGDEESSDVPVMVWTSPLPDELEQIELWLKVTKPSYYSRSRGDDVTYHDYSYQVKIILDYKYDNYAKCQSELEAAEDKSSVF